MKKIKINCKINWKVKINWIMALHHSGLNLSSSKIRFGTGIQSIRHRCLRSLLLRSLFFSSLFSFFSPPSYFETRSSISSFLERSQMAFLLMLAVGCTLTFGGEKSAIPRQERSLWTAQWLLHSVRNGHWGSEIPFYIASISLLSSTPVLCAIPGDSCIATSTCVIVSYTHYR